MNHRALGRTGLKVSEVSLGCMAFGRWIDKTQSHRVLDAALDAGITLLDTADVYGRGMDTGNPLESGESEAIMGPWLKDKRGRVILATKVNGRMGQGPNDKGLSRFHIMNAVEDSLRRLNTDYIDLYQVHRFDPETPLDETLSALTDLVHQGKVRYIGCSNYAAWQIAKAHGISALRGFEKYVSVQPQYSILARDIERELLPFCQSEGVGVIVYSPLGRGLLTGKYSFGESAPQGTRGASAGDARLKQMLSNERYFTVVNQLKKLAAERGWTLAQFALAWVLNNKVVSSAILGISRPEQIADAVLRAGEQLTKQELDQVDQICQSSGLIKTND